MSGKDYNTYKAEWPTPQEAMAKRETNNAKQLSTECSQAQPFQHESQPSETTGISFLQPSVVSPSYDTNEFGELPHPSSYDDSSVKIHDLNPNIHKWSQTLEEDTDVAEQLHPAIASQLKACKTADDHNCLYNAVCLCLGLHESKQYLLREKTAECMRKHANHFDELLKASAETESLETIIAQCTQPFLREGWGNQFHVLALAITLKRNIIIYTAFKGSNGQFFQRKNKNIVGLAAEFSQGGEKIEQHQNFEPQKGVTTQNPICLYLSGIHFTALVPKLENAIYCIPPATNLPSIPDNGMQVLQSETPTKMTRKARWLASMSPSKRAEHKEREKAKRHTRYIKERDEVTKKMREQYEIPEVQYKKKKAEKERYSANPEPKKMAVKEKYATDPKPRKKAEQERYAANPEPKRKAEQERYAAHSDEIKQTKRRKYASNPQEKKEAERERYAQKQTENPIGKFQKLLAKARKTVSQLPILACTVCHRIRYREQVVQCNRTKYPSDKPLIQQCLTGEFIHICPEKCNLENTEYHELLKKEWICHTCHSTLKRGKMPVQAIINGLKVEAVPDELKVLNPLERHLIALVQAFIKIIPLPRGGQMGIRGQLVCVPADLQQTADSLPWTPNVEHLIRVKLKRKVEFKGHHLFMNVSQRKIMDALLKLKEINPLYKDVALNENWIADIIQRGYQEIVTELRLPTLEEAYEAFILTEQEEMSSMTIPLQELPGDTTSEYDSFIQGEMDTHSSYFAIQKELQSCDVEKYAIENDDENEIEYRLFHAPEVSDSFQVCLDEDELNEVVEATPVTLANKHMTNQVPQHTKDQTGENHRSQNPYNDVENPFPMITLQPIDPAVPFSDKDVMSIAPSEGQTPVKQMESEGKCFPCKFPLGKSTFVVQDENGDYVQDRLENISISKYCDSRVYCAKNQFDDDGEYLAFLQCVKERDQINSAASIALRKSRSTNVDGTKITAGSIVHGNKLRGGILKNNQGYKYFNHLQGSPPYWEAGMTDLFASFKQIGPPNVFISFSAADRRWPEIAKAALIRSGQNPDLYSTLSWSEYCNLINRNPVAAVTMFERRVKEQVKLIKSSVEPLGGKVLDGFLRREMQDRGWPHIHGIFWIEGAPSINDDEDAHIKFVEKIISCSIPDQNTDPELYDIVMSVQRHSKTHSRTCFKNKSDPEECRFGIPLPISDETFILHPGSPPKGQDEREWKKKAKAKIKEIKRFLSSTDDLESWTVDQVLKKHGLTKEVYREYLSALCKRDHVVLKRQPCEAFINFYNDKLLRFWNGNMDVQYIFNPHAVVKYCMSYITKAERELGDLLRRAQQESREGNKDAVQELKHLGDVYLTHRRVCQMETIYRLTMLPLKEFSRETVFLPIDQSSFRFTLPLKKIATLEANSDDIWAKNVIDKYLARPNCKEFDGLCLADFAANYSAVKGKQSPEEEIGALDDENDNAATSKPNHYHLLNNMGMIRKRQKARIIKYYKVPIHKDRERYYHNLLRLYMPHREWKLPEQFETYEEWYTSGHISVPGKGSCTVSSIVDDNYNVYEQSAEIIERCEEEYRQGAIDSHEDAWADLAPGAEEERHEQAEEMGEILDQHAEHEKEIHKFQNMTDCPIMATISRDKVQSVGQMLSQKEILEMIRQTNTKQYNLVMYIRDWCLKTIRGEKPDPFYIHLSGSAGVGKSHVTTTTAHLVRKLLQPLCQNADQEVVFLSAFTGTASFNVRGETLHSLFQLPLHMTTQYVPLKHEALATLQAKLSSIKLLVIDEISLIKHPLFVYIHGRLKQAVSEESNTAPFGNVSILAVGDFYQIPPPLAEMIFKSCLEADFLWEPFTLFNLEEIVRQKDDIPFSEFLNRIRTCRRGEKDLCDADKQLLKSREIKYNPKDPKYPSDAYHVFAENKDVDYHNQIMLKLKCQERILLHPLEGKANKSKDLENSSSIQDFYKQSLEVGIGARVLLKVNLDVKDGLANGAMGTVVHFSEENLENGEPKVMYIKFDDADVGRNLRHDAVMPKGIPRGSTPLLRQGSPSKSAGKVWYQFPVGLAWAGTLHKAQGKTLEKIVVSTAKIRNTGQAYVGFSRVKSSDGLFILNLNFKKIFCDPEVQTLYSEMPKLNVPCYPTQMPHSISVMHHNCEGILTHLPHLQRILQDQFINIICLTETHLTENLNSPLPGYRFLQKNRHDSYNDKTYSQIRSGGGGGVGIFVKTNFAPNVTLISPNLCELEYIGLKVVDDTTSKYTVYCVYRPPKLDMQYFLQQLKCLLSTLDDEESVILVGDMNEHAPASSVNAFLSQKGFNQLIKEPTTIHNNKNILDHCYTRNIHTQIQSGVLPIYYSFHEAIYLVSNQ